MQRASARLRSDFMQRYSAKMLEHFHAPRNPGALPDPQIVGRGSLDGRAPRTEIYVKFAGDVIQQVGFTTFGCGASIACASVLTELISGRTVAKCREITAKTLIEALDGLPPDKEFCAQIVCEALNDLLRQWDGLRCGR